MSHEISTQQTIAFEAAAQLAKSLKPLSAADRAKATSPIRAQYSEAEIRRAFSPNSNHRSPESTKALKRLVDGSNDDYERVDFALRRHLEKFVEFEKGFISSDNALIRETAGVDDGALFETNLEFLGFIHEVEDALDVNLDRLDADKLKTVRGLSRALVTIFRDAALDTKSPVSKAA